MSDAADLKRARFIKLANAKLPAPTRDELAVLADRGLTTWGDYIANVADEHGTSYGDALTIFDLYGPSEAFDGFVTSCEDHSAGMEDADDD